MDHSKSIIIRDNAKYLVQHNQYFFKINLQVSSVKGLILLIKKLVKMFRN